MSEFADLQERINASVKSAINTFFADKEASAIDSFKAARRARKAPKNGTNRNKIWHETYTIQVERTVASATIRIDGLSDTWQIQETWIGSGNFTLQNSDPRANGVIEYDSNVESLVQQAIMIALSNAYCGLLE